MTAAQLKYEQGLTLAERHSSTLRNAEFARAYALGGSDSSDSGLAARKWEQALQSRLAPTTQRLPNGNFEYVSPPPLSSFELEPVIERYGKDKRLLPAYLKNDANFVEAFETAVLEFEKDESFTPWYKKMADGGLVRKMEDGGLVRKMEDGSTVTREDVRLLLKEQAAEEEALEEKKQTLSYWEEEDPEALAVSSKKYTQVPINVLTENVFNKEYKEDPPFDPAGVASGMAERYFIKPVSDVIEKITAQDPITYWKDDELMKSHLRDLSVQLRLRLPESVKSGSEGGDRRGMAVEIADKFDARVLDFSRHKTPSEVARAIKDETLPGLIKQLESIQALQEGPIAGTQGSEKTNALTYLIAKFGAAAKFFANEGRGNMTKRDEIMSRWTNRGQ